ncbi:unnamed protein product [marine sediment metagenome]|uniref:Uncharacterized protein n=1 Tax=marine sediment metagenome TaxID=412755 RepID=X1FSH8_9ZZZZ
MDREKVEIEVKEQLVEIKNLADEILKELSDIPDEVLDQYPGMLSQHLQDMQYPTL